MGIFNLFGKSKKPTKKRQLVSAKSEQAANAIIAAYQDVAGDDPATVKHFEDAKTGAHSAIFDKTLRQTLIDYARFEVANSPNLKGIVVSKVNDVVGRSPKLRFLPDPDSENDASKKAADSLTRKFAKWSKHVRMGIKLRTACSGKVIDGESFMMVSRNKASRHPLQLDIRLFDPERVTEDPVETIKAPLKRNFVDGIRYDAFGNPVEYHVMKDHPTGDQFNRLSLQKDKDFLKVPRDFMFHWFRRDRPEQIRGVSELASALPIATLLRRVTKAVAINTEIAASIAFLLETDYDGDEIEDSDGNTITASAFGGFNKVDYEAGTSMILPDKVKPSQLKTEHPNSSFQEFHNTGINSIGRGIGMPFNKSSGRSADYNYSSARLDHLADDFGNSVTREELVDECLDPIILRLWIAFAIGTDGYLDPLEKQYLQDASLEPLHLWSFDSFEDIDRAKEATGKQLECAIGANNRGHLLMQAGFDMDSHDMQAASSYGMTVEEYRKAVAAATFNIKEEVKDGESKEKD